MSVQALHKRSPAPDQLAVEEAQRRPERGVLCECEAEGESLLFDSRAPPDEVECKAEQRTVSRMHNEAAGEPDVGVVAAKQAPIERLLQSPHRRRDGSCQRCTHTL